MPLVFNDPQYWHERAKNARAVAERMSDIEGWGRMMAIADQYDMLAERAVERLKTGAAAWSAAKLRQT